MFGRIVVGVDGSQSSENAWRVACELARNLDSELHLVYTPQPATVAFALGAVAGYRAVTTLQSSDEVSAACERVLGSCRDIAGEYDQTITETYTDVGEPADRIVECAQTIGASLIVTGRRGLGSIGSLVQGSTTQRVNQLAGCACLSVV